MAAATSNPPAPMHPSRGGPLCNVQGKTLLFTTTNGSQAAQHVKSAGTLVFGSFVNMTAVREAVRTLFLLRTPCCAVACCCGGSGCGDC